MSSKDKKTGGSSLARGAIDAISERERGSEFVRSADILIKKEEDFLRKIGRL